MSDDYPTYVAENTNNDASTLEGVRAALQVGTTSALRRSALRFARTRADLVRHAGGRPDRLYVRELVADALADTWTGDLQWDPTRCTLLDHVCGAIRRRTSDDAERVRRYQHQPIDRVLGDRDDSPARTELESFLARQGEPSELHADLAALVADVISELRLLANRADAGVRAILDAWARGIVQPEAVASHGGLTTPAYRAARDRIRRLVPQLPPEIRGAVVGLLRRAS